MSAARICRVQLVSAPYIFEIDYVSLLSPRGSVGSALTSSGIAGTPVIDPGTNTVYFFAKGYQDGASSGGVAKGIYK